MARRKCPEGVFCIDNLSLLVICIVIVLLGWCIYFVHQGNKNHRHAIKQRNHFVHNHNNLAPHMHELPHHPMFNVSSQSIVPETGYNTLRPIAHPSISFNSDPKDTLMNPYSPPVQVNQPHAYRQIGYLKNPNYGNKMYPIFAKPQHVRRDKWYYYTIYDNIKLPIYYKNRKCSSDHGCDSLMNGDVVKLENMSGDFVVTTYDNESLVYDPVI